MSEHWSLAVSTGCCTGATFAGVLDALVEAGADRIEIGTPPAHFDARDPLAPLRLSEALDRSPLVPVSMHAPFGRGVDLASPVWEARDAGIAAALTSARSLMRHPGAILVVHPSDLPRDGNAERHLRHALESLLHIDHGCRDLGVRLALETPLPHLVGGHPEELQWILDRLPPSVGVCLDTGHAHLARFVETFIDLARERLMHVHIHDNHGTHDDHLIPGEGAVDWCGFFEGLRRVRYGGALVLELSCNTPSAPYFRTALDAARVLCGRHAPHMLPPSDAVAT